MHEYMKATDVKRLISITKTSQQQNALSYKQQPYLPSVRPLKNLCPPLIANNPINSMRPSLRGSLGVAVINEEPTVIFSVYVQSDFRLEKRRP